MEHPICVIIHVYVTCYPVWYKNIAASGKKLDYQGIISLHLI